MNLLLAATIIAAVWNPPLTIRHDAPKRTLIRAAELPAPNTTESAHNPPRVIWQPEHAVLNVPAGFSVEMFAGEIRGPKQMAETPNGDVLVTESRSGRVLLLRGSERFVLVENLQRPAGLAVSANALYVGQTGSVVRYAYTPGRTRITSQPVVIGDVPPKGYREHWTRYLALSPDGTKLYVTVGSQTDADVEPDPRRGTIMQFDLAKGTSRVYAGGLRNATGLAFQPRSGVLWASVNERDGLGDEVPPDFVTSIRDGGFYGWPYAYAGAKPDPRNAAKRPELVKTSLVPEVLIEAHSASLGMAFYDGAMFPPEYRGDAFVALHGSWNRTKRTGYKVIRIRFKDGKPAGGYEDFLTGFMLGEDQPDVWGRPVSILVLRDGSLLVSDDGGGKIWRVTYSR